MKSYLKNIKEVLQNLDTDQKVGLTTQEAEKRHLEYGENVLNSEKGKSLIRRFVEQLLDPMIIVLLVAALVSGILAVIQNEGFVDVIIILVVVVLNAVLGVYQESKAEKAIEALQKMSKATSKVLRDGSVATLESDHLVPGDVVLLEAGDAVPADGRLIETASLKVEEAALTGESLSVEKHVDTIEKPTTGEVPLGDRKNMVYMGSTVVYGRGIFVVTETGMNTEMGKIADVLLEAKEQKTPLQMRLSQLSKILTFLVLGICVLIFAIQLIKERSFDYRVLLNSFMIAVSLAVAAIPEGLAAVVTVVLSIGVTNMSKKNAIIRKLTAVETLGCAQVICSDKTGTLTQNKMTVVDFFGDDEKQAAMAMALCSDAEIDEYQNITGEPTEAALVSWAYRNGANKRDLAPVYFRIGEAPFDSGRKMMTTIHKHDEEVVQFTKGAPDVLLEKCEFYLKDGEILPLTEGYRKEVARMNKEMADRALRVLAVAKKELSAVPEAFNSGDLEKNLIFMGLAGMIDPIRAEVKDAIVECKSAGIRTIMITGDHIDTATAIAKDLGILGSNEKTIRGMDLDQMDDEVFEKVFKDISVYARVQPEHKTRIVTAWQKAGFVTAMTGDGVNDAPSIKKADIGIGMGITGTDVTKNVADMVLADDNFATIVHAVKEGRRIYDNIRKSIQFLLGSNMSEVLSIFFATILGFIVLKPVHLLWINLLTDSFPALGLGMEKAEYGIMSRKPRSSKAGVFSEGMGVDIIYQSMFVTALVLFSYVIGHAFEFGKMAFGNSDHGMAMAFITLSLAEIFHAFNLRSQRGSIFRIRSMNKVLLLSSMAAFLLTVLVFVIPFVRGAFGFPEISAVEFLIATGIAILIIPLVELMKLIQRK